MIPLNLPAIAESAGPFVTRLRASKLGDIEVTDSVLVDSDDVGSSFVGQHGLLAIDGASAESLDGDVVLVSPISGRAERLIRRDSRHNTLLVTEQCDQLCVMCSQPPKKTHVDRFALLEQACLLAEPDTLIGVSGGEPTLYKVELLRMIENVLTARPDLRFHVLTNGQHFEGADLGRLRNPRFRRVSWGVPLYAAQPEIHDEIVGKEGAFERLHDSFAVLLAAGARVELRTVVLATNVDQFADLASYVATRLKFVEVWSIMQLEHIGFAKGRWRELFYRHDLNFAPIAAALDGALAHGVHAQLFNFPLCTVPTAYRPYAIASISDWKNKTIAPCETCSASSRCAGFFEWHPDEDALAVVRPL